MVPLQSTPGHALRTVVRVAAAELRGALRDRQVLVYTLLLPLALYPALLWVLIQGRALIAGRDEARVVRVAVVAPEGTVERLAADLAEAPDDLEGALPGTLRFEHLVAAPADPRAFLRGDDAPELLWSFSPLASSLSYLGTNGAARLGLRRLEERLGPLRRRLRLAAFEGAGGSESELDPFRLELVDVAGPEALSRHLFSLFLPLTFVLMAVFGAFYPAVDATSGERERRTMDTTLLLPVPRSHVLVGKLVAVAAAAAIASTLNLAGLTLAADPLVSALDPTRSIVVPWTRLLAVLPLCCAFLVTVSALLFAVAATTRTFKQGQALLGPVQVFFLVPAVIGVLPGVALTPLTALVPVLQTVLAFRTLLAADPAATWPLLALAFFSQLAYAWLAVRIALRFHGPESTPRAPRLLRRIVPAPRSS